MRKVAGRKGASYTEQEWADEGASARAVGPGPVGLEREEMLIVRALRWQNLR